MAETFVVASLGLLELLGPAHFGNGHLWQVCPTDKQSTPGSISQQNCPWHISTHTCLFSCAMSWHRHKVTHLTANDYAMPYMMLSLISHQVLSFSDLVRRVRGREESELRPGSKARRLCSPTCRHRRSDSLRPKTLRGVSWGRGNCTTI